MAIPCRFHRAFQDSQGAQGTLGDDRDDRDGPDNDADDVDNDGELYGDLPAVVGTERSVNGGGGASAATGARRGSAFFNRFAGFTAKSARWVSSSNANEASPTSGTVTSTNALSYSYTSWARDKLLSSRAATRDEVRDSDVLPFSLSMWLEGGRIVECRSICVCVGMGGGHV